MNDFSSKTNLSAKPDVNLQDTEQVWEANFDDEPVQKASGNWNTTQQPPTSQFQEISLHERPVPQAAEETGPSKPPRTSNYNQGAPLPAALDDNPW
jgi:hypothetical protein